MHVEHHDGRKKRKKEKDTADVISGIRIVAAPVTFDAFRALHDYHAYNRAYICTANDIYIMI